MGTVWTLLYVDDIILMGNSEKYVDTFKQELGKHFDIKDHGTLHACLRVVIVREEKVAWLTQEYFVSNVRRRLGMDQCEPVDTPISTGAMKESEEVDGGSTNCKWNTKICSQVCCLCLLERDMI